MERDRLAQKNGVQMKLSGKPRRRDRCGEAKNGVREEFELASHGNGLRAQLRSARAGGGRSGSLSRVLYVVPGRIQSLQTIMESIQMKLSKSSLQLALAVGLALGAPAAFAATAAGVTISNTATVNFSVGGVAQTAQNSNTATFLVDRSINLTVAEQDASIIQVVPGQSAAVTTFKVTNNSNSTEDFALSAADAASGVTVLGGTDNSNTGTLSVFVESGATAGYQSGQDTATFIDELAAGASATVYVVANIPAGATNGQVAAVALTATAAQSTNASTGQYIATPGTLAANAVQTNVGSADNPNFVDTVFADAAGATDAANDGKFSAYDAYKVVTATIAVVKSSYVISDPVNGTSNPKAIPGAVIEYCLAVSNSGSASATGVTLTDAIPTNTTYVASTIKVNSTAGSGGSNTCSPGTGTAVADSGDSNGDFGVTQAGDVTVKAGTVTSSSTFRAVFRVTVN